MKTKNDSVQVKLLHPMMWWAWGVTEAVYSRFKNRRNCVVTSGNDGRHMVGSLHYEDKALDFRIWGFGPGTLKAVTVDLKRLLGKKFDVVLEKDHFHIEYDPK